MPIRNVATPIYLPAENPSLLATVDIPAGRFTAVTAAGVEVSSGTSVGSGLTRCGFPAANADKHSGVTHYDVTAGREVEVQRSGVVTVTAAATITSGAYVGTDAQGRAVVAAGRATALGEAWSNAAAGESVHVALF